MERGFGGRRKVQFNQTPNGKIHIVSNFDLEFSIFFLLKLIYYLLSPPVHEEPWSCFNWTFLRKIISFGFDV